MGRCEDGLSRRIMTSRRLTSSRCLCRGCGEYFNSVRAFDRHRVWASPTCRRCLSVYEMQRKGMCVNGDQFWITEPRHKHRVKSAVSRISAGLSETPLGYQGDTVIRRRQEMSIARAERQT